MANQRQKILGVGIDNLSRAEILEKVGHFLSEERFHQIATINPEFILEAKNNEKYREVLNSCDLALADGSGIFYAFLKKFRILKYRFPGADLLNEILDMASDRGLAVFLACRMGGLSTFEETRTAIVKKYPNLPVAGEDIDIRNTGYKILDANYQILLCNFGAPHQELFISRHKCDKIRLAMGVGGSFDFFTGKVKRAPLFLRRMGLEWLWRLFQPQEWNFKKQRIRRIFRAVVVFPIKVILNK